MAWTRGGFKGSTRIFKTPVGVNVHRVDGQYRYQHPTLKFACVRVLDHNFPDSRDSKLYTNVQLCLDELVNLVEVRVKGIKWGGMIKVVDPEIDEIFDLFVRSTGYWLEIELFL